MNSTTTKRLIFSLAICATLSNCATTDSQKANNNPQFSPRADNPFLSQQQAQYRSQRLKDVDYQLDFKLSDNEVFSATTAITFHLSGVNHPITIDLNQAQINELEVNGNKIAAQNIHYNDAYITIDPKQLHHGNNHIEISYQRTHSTNGEGLHRFKDPVDGKVYLYSHFEPAAAHQMFPGFDQPDLKASYQVNVTAPADWHVISTMTPSQAKLTATEPELKRWTFPKTPRLSSYNFSLHAGPYHVWHDNSGKYPARLFARQSVKEQVDPQLWFNYTKQGLAFFEDYFAIPYPFEKYDQLIVPDFVYGAMENAAAVTFAERLFLDNRQMTEHHKQRLASVIMHEMAHQWFGDLVTMKWWNGLWLNESFAAFMAALATAEATEFDNTWRIFYAKEKQSAYRTDTSISTHPIEVPVPSSANAFDNIDAITYSKGAAVLNQLRHLLTPEVFRQGVHHYLSTYSYQNASLNDFITSLSKTAKRDLSQWKQHWLYQSGVNTIAVDHSCDNDKISHFNIIQRAPTNYPVYREQKINIGLFNYSEDGQLRLTQAQPVIYQGKQTQVTALIGKPCPQLIYPNYQDWAYVLVDLDQQSYHTAKTAISKVNEPLLRSMLWQSIWDSVQSGHFPLSEFLTVAINNIATEQDTTILLQVLHNLERSIDYLHSFGQPADHYRQQISSQLEQLTWQQLKTTQAHHYQWFNAHLDFATSEQATTRLIALLEGHVSVNGFTLRPIDRWNIIRTLSALNHPLSDSLIQQELKRDHSDASQKLSIAARAAMPVEAQKRYWLEQLFDENSQYPFAKLRVAMANLYPAPQHALQRQTADEVLSQLIRLDQNKSPIFIRTYANFMIPKLCDTENQDRLKQFIHQQTGLTDGTMRTLKRIHQNVQRCVKIADTFSKHSK